MINFLARVMWQVGQRVMFHNDNNSSLFYIQLLSLFFVFFIILGRSGWGECIDCYCEHYEGGIHLVHNHHDLCACRAAGQGCRKMDAAMPWQSITQNTCWNLCRRACSPQTYFHDAFWNILGCHQYSTSNMDLELKPLLLHKHVIFWNSINLGKIED